MEPVSLLGYLLVFLFLTIGAATLYTRLNAWKLSREREMDRELTETEERYKELVKEVKQAQSQESLLKAELLELKKTAAREQASRKEKGQKATSPGENHQSALDILEKKGVLTKKQMEKARNYLAKSDNPGLKLEDSLIMLGFLTLDQLQKARRVAEGAK